MATINLKKKKFLNIGIAFIFFLAIAFRLIYLGGKVFYADEGTTWFLGLREISSDAHPQLYFWLLYLPVKLLPWTETSGRILSAIFGILTVPLFYMIAKKFFDKNFALLIIILTSISAFLVMISQEMRMYALVGFESVLAIWFFLNIVTEEKPSNGYWIGLLLSSLAGIYTHTMFVFLLVYFGIALFIISFKTSWKKLGWYLGAMAILVVLYLPQLIDTAVKAGTRRHVFAASLWHVKVNITRIAESYVSFLYGSYFVNLPGSLKTYMLAHPLYMAGGIIMVLAGIYVFVYGLVAMFRIAKNKDKKAISARIMLGLLLFATILFVFMDVSTARQMFFIYIPFIFVITAYFIYGNQKFASYLAVLLIVLNIVCLLVYFNTPYFPYERVDWRSAADCIWEDYKSDDAMFFVGSRNMYYTMKFYIPEMENEVYYRARPDYPDDNPNQHQVVIDWDKTASDWIKKIMETRDRLWVIGWVDEWMTPEFKEQYIIESDGFGSGFAVQLFQKKNPVMKE